MKKIFKLFVLPLIVLSCSDAELPATEEALDEQPSINEEQVLSDEPFHSEDGKFAVEFPGTPKEESSIIPTEVGDIEMHSFLYERSATEAYVVSYNDYPTELVENSDVQTMLDGAVQGSSSNLGITQLDVETKLEISGYPGRYFRGNNGTYFAEYKLFMAKNRLYQIAIIRDGSYASPERVDTFFGSFILTR